MIFQVVNNRINWLFLLLVSITACDQKNSVSSEREAIQIAKDRVVELSSSLDGHIPIKREELIEGPVTKEAEGGWYVTLYKNKCKYIVYSHPGVEVEIAGSSAACKPDNSRRLEKKKEEAAR